ncbi:hypothetical protein OH77DRAFT_471706 [Trametes cingulata]|nr:hypothetical protein OH77DRAFT_471706 [Trametes cingulata]
MLRIRRGCLHALRYSVMLVSIICPLPRGSASASRTTDSIARCPRHDSPEVGVRILLAEVILPHHHRAHRPEWPFAADTYVLLRMSDPIKRTAKACTAVVCSPIMLRGQRTR